MGYCFKLLSLGKAHRRDPMHDKGRTPIGLSIALKVQKIGGLDAALAGLTVVVTGLVNVSVLETVRLTDTVNAAGTTRVL